MLFRTLENYSILKFRLHIWGLFFLLFINTFYGKNLYAQKLPKIFQKPIVPIPDTNKIMSPNQIQNDSSKKEILPKFLPMSFNVKLPLEDTLAHKKPILDTNSVYNPSIHAQTQVAMGNYGNLWIKNRVQTPFLWKKWRFFSEIFFQNSQQGAVVKEYSGNRFFGAEIGTQFTYKKISITTQITTKAFQNRFYNYDPNILQNFDKDTLKQQFINNTFKSQILYADTAKKRFLEGEIKFQFWQKIENKNIPKATEHNIGFRINYTQILLNAKNNDINKKKINTFLRNTTFNSELEFWLMPRKEQTLYFKRNFLQVSPNLTYQLPNYPIKIVGGFRVSYDNDDLKLYKRLHLYPNFAFLYHINKNFEAKILYDGQTIKNNLVNFSEQNPWIEPNILVINTQQKQNLRIKIQYNILSKKTKFKYNLYFEQGFTQNENMPLWVNAPLDSAKFSLVYDKISINNFIAGGQGFLETKHGKLYTKANWSIYNYQTYTQTQAWHLPQFTTNIEVRFMPKKGKKYVENMQFWLKLQGEFQRKYLDTQTKEQNLLNIVDLSLGGEYLFSKKTATFLSFFNIFNQKNPIFAGYIAQGFNFLVGITHKIGN